MSEGVCILMVMRYVFLMENVFAMIYKFWHGICVSLIVSTIHWYVDNLINQTIVKHSSPLSKRTK